MKTLITKSQAFMHCVYNDPADYIDEQWMADTDNIQTLITLLRLNIADDLQALAHGIQDAQEEFGIDSNTEFDFALLLDLKALLKEVSHNVQTV